METVGEILRKCREEKGEPLRKVAAFLDIDQAILSKIERGQRNITREQVDKLAGYFGVDAKKLHIARLSQKIMYSLEEEEYAQEALKAAEDAIAYRKFIAIDKSAIIKKIKQFLKRDGRVRRAWIFGSFARGDDQPGSDIDMMIEESESNEFNYFDLADIQYKLEQMLKRKVDIGFASSLKEHVAENIRNEAKLIYEV